MSTFSGGSYRESRTPSPPADGVQLTSGNHKTERSPSPTERFPEFPASPARNEYAGPVAGNDTHSTARPGRQRSSSRPLSMIQTYQPLVMDTNDTIPELQPVFTLLNNHANKLYQEGYFLKLDDQNTLGTVLSLWDAAELDATGQDGEVLPKFINLTDASIKVIDALPTRSTTERPLQNVLSVSTAGRNRYLLHFNSHHSLIQWTSGIRLAMFEHSTLQEAYTGALIAGKGRLLNNINLIMSPAKFKTEEWVRVRFGAGVPWRRCWCVISPPDEKEVMKLQKDMKKRSPYDRSHAPVLRGEIKFYDTRKEGKKQKKAKPIATITNAYSAYAIYPQSKALIDASSLIKLEGTIVIHSDPVSTTEGFVFMMPEVPNAVSGFEMLLRFLFPTWDIFALYGRPSRLVASTLDTRSLMFAMPKHRRYGYLELMDVSTLVLTEGSGSWTEREWRKRLKDMTAKRMSAMDESASSGADSNRNSRRSSKRLSFGPGSVSTTNSFPTSNSMGAIGMVTNGDKLQRTRVGFADSSESTRPSRLDASGPQPALRNDSAPPASDRQRIPSSMAQAAAIARGRNNSDTGANNNTAPPYAAAHSTYDTAASGGNAPGYFPNAASSSPATHVRGFVSELATTPERVSSEDDFSSRNVTPPQDLRDIHQRLQTPEPVKSPPAFHHPPSSRPAAGMPFHSAELRRANSRLSNTTLAQIVNANAANSEGLPMPDMNNAHDSRPGSQGSNSGVLTGAPMPSSSSNSSFASPGQLHTPSSTAPHLAYSKSPLNQAHNALAPAPTFTSTDKPLPNPVDGPSQASVSTSNGPLPRVPVPMSGHTGFAPSHMHDAMNGRQILTQGPAPPTPPYNAQSSSPLPYRPSPSQTRPSTASSSTSQQAPGGQPERLRTPPPQAGQAPGANPLSPLNTSPPINRKPVPTRADSVQGYKGVIEPQSAQSSAGSMQGYYIDEDAFAKVQYGHSIADDYDTNGPRRAPILRQDTKRSEASSKYEDASSTTSPDYASTHESVHTQESVERPRAGVLRTVGDTSTAPQQPKEDLAIPEVNFGPTYNYAAANLPRNMTQTPLAGPSNTSRSFSPTSGATAAAVSATAAMTAATAGTAKTRKFSNDNTQRTPEYNHRRQDSDDTIRRRSVAWQPGGSMLGPFASNDGRPTPGTVTPEQFVLQRAQASTPVYAHQRVPSNNSMLHLRKNTPSPSAMAVRRRSSFDMLSNSPNPQYQQQQRPSSQGATAALGSHVRNTSSTNVGSHLSAREQEHLARATGSPLINMAGNGRSNQDSASGPGLVGAIAARERTRSPMPAMGSPQSQSSYGSPQMGMPGGWPTAQSPQPQQQQHMQGYTQQGYGGGSSQYAPSQMGAPRARTPGPSNPSMIHHQPGQAF
ncbi:ph domain-containing protein [Ophiostoma piceae UAMH 11346]|uniref:Ph domain-containing protein n=1 Tax=Ophiostoma piceae (strain UAMH 11346) TaxID=1262450 RepID=S3C5U5_OPHP1|nr:ph domain-containing protein [Ophiostoma piceae UAMH 11346]